MKYIYLIYFNEAPFGDIAYKHESTANKVIESLNKMYPERRFYTKKFKVNVEGNEVAARV